MPLTYKRMIHHGVVLLRSSVESSTHQCSHQCDASVNQPVNKTTHPLRWQHGWKGYILLPSVRRQCMQVGWMLFVCRNGRMSVWRGRLTDSTCQSSSLTRPSSGRLNSPSSTRNLNACLLRLFGFRLLSLATVLQQIVWQKLVRWYITALWAHVL